MVPAAGLGRPDLAACRLAGQPIGRYTADMTKRLEQAIAKIRALSEDRQDEAAELLLSLAEQDPAGIRLNPEQVAEVSRRLKEPAAYATHADVRAFFKQ